VRRAAALLLAVAAGCPTNKTEARTPQSELVTRSAKVMGTQVSLTAWTAKPKDALRAFSSAFEEMNRLDQLMSVWKRGSDVVRINEAAGADGVVVAKATLDVIAFARRFSEATGGKFDVTFGALSGLWKFDHDQDDRIPAPEAVAKRLPFIDYTKILVDEQLGTVRLAQAGMRMHLGGVGKGYAVDRAVAILRKAGLRNFMVQSGGDLYVSGKKGDRNWRVGIRDPRGPATSYFAGAEITNATFSTSGDYERFFVEDGVRYHHIIDPDTGQPARHCRSVTIMAKDAITADVLSTSVFLVGVEAGLALVESTDGAGAVIVDAANEVHISKRLEGKIRILRPPTP